jgi:hypothetical protein
MVESFLKTETVGVGGTGSWRPSTATTDVNVNIAEQLLKEDRSIYCADTLRSHLRNAVWKKSPEFLLKQWFQRQGTSRH